ncbi:unnamed protein product [Miscanthus lutarioriparius]|uniref:Cytochrome b5 heme-binding domain-containing protein n=1 Tax=Miscanthus lutarioriparius TaxID=422564 RepID=A0A811P294_9POAL|nr:unnamed protein product [Miscanthus lutarioriparius]
MGLVSRRCRREWVSLLAFYCIAALNHPPPRPPDGPTQSFRHITAKTQITTYALSVERDDPERDDREIRDLSRRRCVRPAGHRAPRNWLLNSAGHGGPLLLVLSSKRSEHQVPPLPETQTSHQSHLLTDRCSRTSGGGGPSSHLAPSLSPDPCNITLLHCDSQIQSTHIASLVAADALAAIDHPIWSVVIQSPDGMVAVKGPAAMEDTKKASEKTKPDMRRVTSAEMARHCVEGDVWVAVQGKVYDVTAWLPHHPGGDLPLLSLAGQDVTDAFVAYHPASAWRVLDRYRVATLSDYAVSEVSRDYRRLVAASSPRRASSTARATAAPPRSAPWPSCC